MFCDISMLSNASWKGKEKEITQQKSEVKLQNFPSHEFLTLA